MCCVVCMNISLDVHQTVMWAVSGAGGARGHWPPHALHTFLDSIFQKKKIGVIAIFVFTSYA